MATAALSETWSACQPQILQIWRYKHAAWLRTVSGIVAGLAKPLEKHIIKTYSQVGLPEAAGSNGKADDIIDTSDQRQDKSANDDSAGQDQLNHLKKTFDSAKSQHRLQLQERNRQIGHLQEDREKLKRLLKKAEGDVRCALSQCAVRTQYMVARLTSRRLLLCRDAQDLVLCTVCQKNNRNCLILPCLHYLLCAGCLQQHTSTCPFCPACKTKVSGLLVVLTSI